MQNGQRSRQYLDYDPSSQWECALSLELLQNERKRMGAQVNYPTKITAPGSKYNFISNPGKATEHGTRSGDEGCAGREGVWSEKERKPALLSVEQVPQLAG